MSGITAKVVTASAAAAIEPIQRVVISLPVLLIVVPRSFRSFPEGPVALITDETGVRYPARGKFRAQMPRHCFARHRSQPDPIQLAAVHTDPHHLGAGQ